MKAEELEQDQIVVFTDKYGRRCVGEVADTEVLPLGPGCARVMVHTRGTTKLTERMTCIVTIKSLTQLR